MVQPESITSVTVDVDADGVDDTLDNCVGEYNPGQADFDSDGSGNACDPDDDGDEVPDAEDNCQFGYNPFQNDRDKDGRGNACDEEINTNELCPDGFITRPSQLFMQGWGYEQVVIKPGDRPKQYCFNADDPLIPSSNGPPGIIAFDWDHRAITSCGKLQVKLEQLFAPYAVVESDHSSGGSIRFVRKRCGDCTNRGIYRVTLTPKSEPGEPPSCNNYHFVWWGS